MERMAKARSPAKQAADAGVKPEHAAIVRTIAAIPSGRVASYGEIAARAGLPRHARLVGRVLGDAGADAKLPWHRVLRADGRFAFRPGSRAFREQRARLIDEGVVVKAGRVDLALFGWQRNLDAEIWRF
ncbi:MAG: MGMT family protein [Proteobacteria bacterium]|nr:MGMT family protein [Pseudomonadota bacterium]